MFPYQQLQTAKLNFKRHLLVSATQPTLTKFPCLASRQVRSVSISNSVWTVTSNHHNNVLGNKGVGNSMACLMSGGRGGLQGSTSSRGRWLKLHLRTPQSSTSLPHHLWWPHTSAWTMYKTWDRTQASKRTREVSGGHSHKRLLSSSKTLLEVNNL